MIQAPAKFTMTLLALAFGVQTHAASIASFCVLKDGGGKTEDIGQINPEKRLPLASVSKVMTAWFAITSKGPNFTFPTEFSVTPVSKDTYEVHIAGSRDPYFGKESLQLAISELNKMGVKKVEKLTFDENFKFFWSSTANEIAHLHLFNAEPSPKTVLNQLTGDLTRGWKSTVSYASAAGLKMVSSPDFKVGQVEFQSKNDFTKTAETRTFVMRSAKVYRLLKEMNRNSNNNAANQIFEHMGGPGVFSTLAKTRLGLGEKDISFMNGSGDCAVARDCGGIKSSVQGYNEATCTATLKILRDMRNQLKESNLDLTNVMAVIGRDSSSTASRLYRNDQTSGTTVAKTGTINPTVALGGLIKTKNGIYYYLINVATEGNANAGRGLIRNKLTQTIRKLGGGQKLDYSVMGFSSIDKNSGFTVVEEEGKK